MTPRRLLLLAFAALLATGGAFWLASQRHLERAVRAGDAVLPQLRGAINDVAEVRIGRGDGSRVTLQRGADGWTVLERHYRADAGKVRKLLLDLAALQVVEEKTHDPARYDVLGVEDVGAPTATGTRIDVKKGSGEIQSLIVGKDGGSRESYVRVAAAKPSFLARPQVAAEVNPARWLDAALVDIDAARIRSVRLEAPAGTAARTLEGERLPAALAGALKGLTFDDVRVQALQGGTPAAVVQRATFVTVEGLSVVVEGREDGTRRWITLGASAVPAAAKPQPAGTVAAAGTDAPAVTGPAAAPAPVAQAAAEPRQEAALLSRRVAGREFEIPAYRFSVLFDTGAAAP